MQVVHSIKELRGVTQQWQSAGDQWAFVPTMGNLHAGHLKLIRHAATLAKRVVVSIYVNPMQFNDKNDFEAYPVTLEEDRYKLAESGVHLLFLPEFSTMYPSGLESGTRVEVPGLSDILCGQFRPGHFVGVTTVVAKLLNIVRAKYALFGEKDFQQLLLIKRMVADLSMPVDIVAVATVRETDGLAMSSRNSYLTTDERAVAPILFRALSEAKARIDSGERNFDAVEEAGRQTLSAAGLGVDYFAVRNANTLEVPQVNERDLVILVAATLGKARLIDNIRLVLKN